MLGGIGGVVFRINRNKINDFNNKVQRVFGEEDITKDEEINTASSNDKVEAVSNMVLEGKSESATITDTEMVAESEQEILQNPEVEERVSTESMKEPAVEHGIVVARDGVLNGHDQSYTVGNILDIYSDRVGNWDGYIDANGNVFIYYQGNKNGQSFAIEFQVFYDDTFKVTGAAKNGEQLDAYSDFFQQILNEIGI